MNDRREKVPDFRGGYIATFASLAPVCGSTVRNRTDDEIRFERLALVVFARTPELYAVSNKLLEMRILAFFML